MCVVKSLYTCPHAVVTATEECTDMYWHTPFPWARWHPSCPSSWWGAALRQGWWLSACLPTGPGACLLPAHSVSPPRPDLVDFSKLTKSNANYNLQRAFRTAEQHLGLTRLLDPEGKPCTTPARLTLGGTSDSNAHIYSILLQPHPKPKALEVPAPSPSPSSSPMPPPPWLPVPSLASPSPT